MIRDLDGEDELALGQEFLDMLRVHAREVGVELKGDMDEVRWYAAERMGHLSEILDEPGYQEALEAETINVLLVAAGRSVVRADALDDRLKALAKGLLGMGARALGLA